MEILALLLRIKKYLPTPKQLDGCILFIETSEEMPFEGSVYRFIVALAELRLLQRFQAILVGYPKAQFCNRFSHEGRENFIQNPQEAIKKALRDYQLQIPVIFNLNFGHTDPQAILFNGGWAYLDGSNKAIYLSSI